MKPVVPDLHERKRRNIQGWAEFDQGVVDFCFIQGPRGHRQDKVGMADHAWRRAPMGHADRYAPTQTLSPEP